MQYGTDPPPPPPPPNKDTTKKLRTNPSPKIFQKYEKYLMSNTIKTIVQKKINLNIDLNIKIQSLSYSIV